MHFCLSKSTFHSVIPGSLIFDFHLLCQHLLFTSLFSYANPNLFVFVNEADFSLSSLVSLHIELPLLCFKRLDTYGNFQDK